MGTACSKIKVINNGLSVIDYGSFNPQGIYTTNVDYDVNIVRDLIRKGHLAPFYNGKVIFFFTV